MYRIHSLRRRRTGFTLIELLVVIGIITVLAAMALGAYFRVVSNQYVKQTETSIRKIATGLNGQWAATISDVQNEIRNGDAAALMSQTGNDRDMANALYLKLRLRQEFPQTFNEATNSSYKPYGIAPKVVYTQAIANVSASAYGTSIPTESAILLYLALTQARRGASFNAADLGGAVGTVQYPPSVGPTFTVFIDAWGTPICFDRWSVEPNRAPPKLPPASPVVLAQGLNLSTLQTELSEPPYAPSPAGSGFKDTTDPFGKLATSGVAGTFQFRFPPPFPMSGTWTPNYAPVVYSFGPDKYCQTADDILSFRLMVAGQKGN